MNLTDKKFIMDNGQEYLTIETLEYDGKSYAYIVNKANPIDSLYVQVIFDGQMKVQTIDPDLFKEKIYPLFLDKFGK